MTDARPDADPTPSKPRGLWSLMGGTPAPADATNAERPSDDEESAASGEPSDSCNPEEPPATIDEPTDEEPPVESATPKRRGLWGMMRQMESAPSANEEATETESSSAAAGDESETSSTEEFAAPEIRLPASRSLFALMQRGEAGASQASKSSDEEPPGDAEFGRDDDARKSRLSPTLSPEDGGEGTEEDLLAPTHSLEEETDVEADVDADFEYEEFVEPQPPAPPLMMDVIEPEELEPPRFRLAVAQARRQGWIGFACGIASVAAAALAMLPHVWSGFPATGLGFAAIIAGYLALTGGARREITLSTRGASLIGMLLGTLGIFLGPLLFANLGRSLREGTGQQLTQHHLEQIGGAIERHYTQHEAYPIGGTFARNDAGAIKGQHGWMTFLLPFVGQDELYHSIEMSQPFDAPINRSAMGRDVVTFFASGGNHSKIGQGFSVSHYAGVGGEIDDERGLSHIGIFERDVAVKRDEVTDGLSNTLIVGELAGTYPPWGDPENWRKIGRGLNRDVNGFGSAHGNGATFLLGDGSVKFFNNKTDPKLLDQLSTRDGGE